MNHVQCLIRCWICYPIPPSFIGNERSCLSLLMHVLLHDIFDRLQNIFDINIHLYDAVQLLSTSKCKCTMPGVRIEVSNFWWKRKILYLFADFWFDAISLVFNTSYDCSKVFSTFFSYVQCGLFKYISDCMVLLWLHNKPWLISLLKSTILKRSLFVLCHLVARFCDLATQLR